MLTAVIPTLNAGATLPATLDSLGRSPDEIIVVDGGSTDATREIAEARGVRVIRAARGRGAQLAAGVAAAKQPWLLLVHADTRLGAGWQHEVYSHMQTNVGKAGYFRFVLDSEDPRARRLERLVAWRSRRLGLPYGDQGLLIYKDILKFYGGIRPLPLMEDVDLVRRIGRRSLVPLETPAVTSAAKWERDGWVLRSARNLACLSLWQAGVPPRVIARLYG
jgi:rSAM/selenodomain-associated transferase 2